MNKTVKFLSVVMLAVILTACSDSQGTSNNVAEAASGASQSVTQSNLTSSVAITQGTTETPEVTTHTTTIATVDTTAYTLQTTTTAASEFVEIPPATETAYDVTETSAESTVQITSEITTEITTSVTTTTPVETTPSEVIKLDGIAAERLSAYGIDTEKRESYYSRIDRKTEIPIVHISTKDKAEILSLEDYTECLVDVFGCEEKYVIGAKEAGIRVRGNSTAYYGDINQIRGNQVPYRIKFSEKTNMLGLNDGAECKSWVLLKSNWNLIMDYTAFELADAIFDGEYYCSDSTFVHLYVNEKFVGVYLLCEQNQVNKNRVDISEPDENYEGTDIGYFVEIDNYAEDGDKPYFVVDYLEAEFTDIEGETRKFVPAEYSIDSDIYSEKQTEFIGSYVNSVFKILYEAAVNDNYLTFDGNMQLVDANGIYSSAYEAVNAVMDINSAVNMYILYEICHDYDCGEGSFYMAVDFSESSDTKRLTFTAPWDFNWAYNDSAMRKYYAGAFNSMSFVNRYGDRTNPWFVVLMTEDRFRDLVAEKWAECYGGGAIPEKLAGIESYIEEYADDLNKSAEWATGSAGELLNWVNKRCKWLDREFSE